MPVTDLSDDDWLQQYLAGQAAVPGGGPTSWAPYGGHPMNYGPPAPSLGGPPQPAQSAPDPNASALGWSLTSNPITRGLNALNPVSSAQADILHPNLQHPNLQNPMGVNTAPSPSRPLPPGAANSLPLASGNPTLEGYNQWLQMQLGRTPAAPATADPTPASRSPIVNGPVWPEGGGSPIVNGPVWPPSGANPANRGVGTNRTPGAGAPQGNPAQTPRPANSSPNLGRYPPFSMIDRANAAATAGQPGRGYQTALDLSGLFGGGRGQAQAPAANPADVPARNAMPTSGQMSSAPWGMGPLQKGMNWPGSYGPDWRTWAAAHSGFQ